jgi:hypothetical protein
MDDDETACPQCGHRLKEDTVYRSDYQPQELLDLGLSPELVAFVFLDPKPEPFRYWCEPRGRGWACYVPEDVSGVYPLWTCNADVIALWMRRGKLEFVELYHDEPGPHFLARTEQGLLAELFLHVSEAEDWQDPAQSLARLRQAADVAGFRHLDELNKWHEQNGNASDFQKRWEQFVASLDKKRRPKRRG